MQATYGVTFFGLFLACCRVIEKKVVSPDQQRAAADYLGERYKISQRETDQPRAGTVAFGPAIPPEPSS